MNRARVVELLEKHLLVREGDSNVVYRDSLGYLTVGIGHRVRPEDNLKLGDRISDDSKAAVFLKDTEWAVDAGMRQAIDLRRETDEFAAALAAVCFQLGPNWPDVFFKSYPALKRGDCERAIRGFERSDWAKQTPVRVVDFVDAIRRQYGQQEKSA